MARLDLEYSCFQAAVSRFYLLPKHLPLQRTSTLVEWTE
jgi:hypothetical protein